METESQLNDTSGTHYYWGFLRVRGECLTGDRESACGCLGLTSLHQGKDNKGSRPRLEVCLTHLHATPQGHKIYFHRAPTSILIKAINNLMQDHQTLLGWGREFWLHDTQQHYSTYMALRKGRLKTFSALSHEFIVLDWCGNSWKCYQTQGFSTFI